MPSPSFAQLCLTDFFVQAQTLRSSLCHDLRYARYLEEVAPPRTKGAVGVIASALDSIVRRLDTLIMDPLLVHLEANQPTVGHRVLAGKLLPPFQALVEQAGVAVGDLEALVSRLPPGMAAPWTRLEASDATPTRILVKLANEVASNLSPLLGSSTGIPRSHITIELAFQDEVYAYDDLGGSDGVKGPQAVVVPTRLAYAPRYSLPLAAHEICHASVRAWMVANDNKLGPRLEAYREIAGPHILGADADALDFLAKDLLTETLVDSLCLKLLGPAYLLAVSAWVFGRHPWTASSHLVSEAAPLIVRLRRLITQLTTEVSENVKSVLEQLTDELDAAGDTGARHLGHRYYEAGVLRLVMRQEWLPHELLEEVKPLQSFAVLNQCWEEALTEFSKAPTWQTIANLDEMRAMDKLRTARHWPEGVTECPPDRTSRILLGHGLGLPECASINAEPCNGNPPLVRRGLGAADSLQLFDNAGVRQKDSWQANSPYLERILGAEVSAANVLCKGGQTWMPSNLLLAESGALLEVALLSNDPNSSDLGKALDMVSACCLGAGGRVARLFRVFGWSDLALLVSAESPAHIVDLVESLSPAASAIRVSWLPSASPSEVPGVTVVAHLARAAKAGGRVRRQVRSLSSWNDLADLTRGVIDAQDRLVELFLEPAQ